jgi:hypothetical protein
MQEGLAQLTQLRDQHAYQEAARIQFTPDTGDTHRSIPGSWSKADV